MKMARDHKSQGTYFLTAGILQIIWGLVPTASKFVIDEIPVELYITMRWTISGLIFTSFLTLTHGWKKLTLRDSAWISMLGILGYGFASFGTLYGLKIGGVVNFALVGAMGPILTSLMSVIILHEKPKRLFYFALLTSFLGLLILAMGKYQVSSFTVAGLSVGLILCACLLEATVFVFSKKLRSKISTLQYLAMTQISAATLMCMLQIMFYKQTSELSHLTMKGILSALFVSIVACVLCYYILYWLLNNMDGHRLALFDGLHSLSAALFGSLFFKEPLRPLMIFGGVLILLGLVVGNLPFHGAEENPELPL